MNTEILPQREINNAEIGTLKRRLARLCNLVDRLARSYDPAAAMEDKVLTPPKNGRKNSQTLFPLWVP